MNHKLDSKTIALNHIAHYLKTIAFNTAKIDQDLHKTPYKVGGYRK